MKTRLGFVCVVLLVLINFLHADKVILKGGRSFDNVIVMKETYKEVSFRNKSSNAPIALPQAQVARIVREESRGDFDLGETFFNSRKYENAISAYKREIRFQTWTHQHCLFKIAECYRAMGKGREAVKAYGKLISKFSDSKYLPQAYYNMGEAYAAGKIWRKSGPAFQKAESIYREVKNRAMALQSAYKKAYSFEKGKRYKDARRFYSDVIKESSNRSFRKKFQKIRNICKARSAYSYVGEKRYKDAERRLLAIAKDPSTQDQEVLGVVYIGLGDCYFKRDRNAKKALFCYLRTVILYSESEAETYAREKAAYCFELLKDKPRAQALRKQ